MGLVVATSILSAGCSAASNETREPDDATTTIAPALASDTVAPQPDLVKVEAAWAEVANTRNAFAASELSISSTEIVGVLADSRSLTLMRFDGTSFVDITADAALDVPNADRDWDIVIQSKQITDDGALDFVVNFGISPLVGTAGTNYGRDWGTVISGDGGTWKSLTFTDLYSGDSYTSIDHIEYTDGALLGDWYGSTGRGTLEYSWESAASRLVGVNATRMQVEETRRPYCASWEFNDLLPIGPCQEGYGVMEIQTRLFYLDYQYSAIEADGYYGRNTEYAIKYFQATVGLRSTGIVDLQTWRELTGNVNLPGTDLNGDGVITPNELSGT